MKYVSPYSQPERLLQSVDTAIRRQLLSEDDPLALALYLWVTELHKPPLINRDWLVSWGISWLRQVFIERRISRRRDEEIASASLALIAIIRQPLFLGIREEVRAGVSELLEEEMSSSLVPFGRPGYGALFLLAAQLLGVEHLRLKESARAVAKLYRASLAGGRLFGISFCVRLLQEIGEDHSLNELERPLLWAIEDPQLGFEDHIYAIQAIQQINGDKGLSSEIVRQIDEVVSKSPIYMYLMVGMEDMPPAGDDHVPVIVSHLYRASLFDVAIQNHERILKQQELQTMTLYQGSRWISWSAFGFPTILLLASWGILIYKILPHLRASARFWLKGDEAAMSFSLALTILGVGVFLLYLTHAATIVIYTLYSVLIRSNIQSDQWAKDKLLPRLWAATKWWAIVVGLTLVLGVFVNVISPRFENWLRIKP